MNTLLSDVTYKYHDEKRIDKIDRKTFGDIVAVSLIGTYTLSALIVSCWSAVLLLTGETSNGGPIGMIFNKMLSSFIS